MRKEEVKIIGSSILIKMSFGPLTFYTFYYSNFFKGNSTRFVLSKLKTQSSIPTILKNVFFTDSILLFYTQIKKKKKLMLKMQNTHSKFHHTSFQSCNFIFVYLSLLSFKFIQLKSFYQLPLLFFFKS